MKNYLRENLSADLLVGLENGIIALTVLFALFKLIQIFWLTLNVK